MRNDGRYDRARYATVVNRLSLQILIQTMQEKEENHPKVRIGLSVSDRIIVFYAAHNFYRVYWPYYFV